MQRQQQIPFGDDKREQQRRNTGILHSVQDDDLGRRGSTTTSATMCDLEVPGDVDYHYALVAFEEE